ncbi:coproporphyrinogen III oxidase family protein, partial [bacterium]|nr:coproporphyrinogen III oxidase family protein [bacterium]
MRPASGTIYVHIPFCAAKCLYCDFASLPERRPPEDRYVDALLRELDARLDEFTGPAPSIYFGGGTPSIFSGAAIARIVAGIRDRVDVAHDAEITLEANPGTVTAEKVDGYLAAGVNRVSMGVQSLRRPVLKALGRIHGEDEVRESVAILRAAGIDNFNLDFMYGLPERTGAMLEEDLATFLDLAPAHLSAYCL